jgi:hypothetical protein
VRAPTLLALLALVAVALLGGCGSDTKSDTGSAQDVLKRAAQTPANSADLKLAMQLRLDGVPQLKRPLKLTVTGPTRSNGRRKLPDVDWRIRAQGAGKKVALRLIATGGNAYVSYEGQTFEVGRQLVRRFMSQSQRNAPQKVRLDASHWLKDGQVGDNGRKVSGQLDVRKMLADVNRLAAKLPRGHQIDKKTIDQVEEAVRDASVQFRVGADHILRSSAFDLRFELPDNLRSKARGLKGGRLQFTTQQTNVNGNQHVTAPSGARPLTELLQRFGVPPGALLGPGFTSPSPG